MTKSFEWWLSELIMNGELSPSSLRLLYIAFHETNMLKLSGHAGGFDARTLGAGAELYAAGY